MSEENVREQVSRILESRVFRRSVQLQRLLGWLAGEDGRQDMPATEYNIARYVLRRPVDFSPKTDSIVRKEMARLREKLDEYYSEEGAQSGWRVCVTPGSYELTARAAAVSSDGERKRRVRVTAVEGLGGIEGDVARREITHELLTQLSRRRSLRVGKADGRWPLDDAEWIVEGTVSQRSKRAPVRVVVRLVEAGTGYTRWTAEKMVRMSRLSQAMAEVAMGVEAVVAEGVLEEE